MVSMWHPNCLNCNHHCKYGTQRLSWNKKDLNDITAAPFIVFFFAAGSWEKDTENGAAVMSLRSYLFCDGFSTKVKPLKYSRFYSFSLQTNKFVKTLLRNAFPPRLPNSQDCELSKSMGLFNCSRSTIARRPFFSRYGRPPVNKHSHRHNMYQMHHCHHSV